MSGCVAETFSVPVTDSQSLLLDWYPSARSARAAVFVHGLGSHRRGEKAVHFAQCFNAKGWAFLALDLRGLGQSDGEIRHLTMSGMLADLAAALSWLEGQAVAAQPILIGASMGAAVAAWYALEHGRKIGGLVAIAPALQFPGQWVASLTDETIEDWKRSGVRQWRSPWIDLEIGFGFVEDAQKYDAYNLAAQLQSPLLIVHGMRDEVIDYRSSVEFAQQSSSDDIDLLLIKDGDHRLTAQKVILFEAVWAWLHRR